MTLQSKRELGVTETKLHGLEELYARTLADTTQAAFARELTLRSLRQSINQLKEEITRFEAHSRSGVQGD